MGCRLRLLISMAVLLGAAWGVAGAGVPDPDLCTVPNVLTSPSHPGSSLNYVVTVVGADGPIDSALVQLVLSAEAAGMVCLCTGQTQPIIEDYTDISGNAVFQIFGGGCLNPTEVVDPPVQVFANGSLIREVGIVSVDVVDNAGLLPSDGGYNPGGSCSTALSDATYITPSLKSGAYNYCTDFNSDLASDLSDAVLVTPAVKVGYICTQAP